MKKLLRAYFLYKARMLTKPCRHNWIDQGIVKNKINDVLYAVMCKCSKCGEWKKFDLE